MNKIIKPLFIAGLLFIASCDKPDLPDPTIAYPEPPAQLMEPSENLVTIPLTEENTSEPKLS